MSNRLSLIPLCLVLAVTVPASAASFAVTPKISTIGYGVDLEAGLSPMFGLRAMINRGNRTENVNKDNIDYSGKIKLNSTGLVADFHPFGTGFRISAGALSNNNKIDLTSKGTGTQIVNGVSYDLATIGKITGDVKFNKTSPYFAIGYGNPVGRSSHWGFTFDLGAVMQGSPKLRVQANPVNPALVPASFYTNLEAERVKEENDLKNYKYLPVVGVGLSFNF